MGYGIAPTATALDPRGLDAIKREVRAGDASPGTIREVARQFESLFAQMLIKSMRETSLGDGIFDSEQGDFYRDIFDQQLSVELSRGQGLGLADMLVRQLSGVGGVQSADAASSSGASPAATTRAGAPAATTGAASAPPTARGDFVQGLWPHAVRAGRALGVDPAAIVSHAALETGWGRALPVQQDGRTSHNLFGVKAGRGWGGAAAESVTTEYVGGTATRTVEPFRAYGSVAESVADYARLLGSSPRYAAALNTGADVGAFAGALQRAGYATDPAYARKLEAVAAEVRRLLDADPSLKPAGFEPIHASTRGAT